MEKLFTDLNKLDFISILTSVSWYAKSNGTKSDILGLTPICDSDKIKFMLSSAGELMRFFSNGGVAVFDEFINFCEHVFELEKGITLSSVVIYNIAKAVDNYFTIKELFSAEEYPFVSSYFTVSKPGSMIYKKILKNIRDDGYLESSASKELYNIREKIEETLQRSKKAVNTFYKDVKKLDYSADDIVSVRDGYECVAVKSNYKGMVDGVVIDYSSTGQTAFVVPSTVFKLNTELNHLHIEENAEVRRILKSYCAELVSLSHELIVIDRELMKFDILHAKVLFSMSSSCSVPQINDNGYINIINGKHPLLGDKAVPLTVETGRDFRVLVITGPNAGGKTVVIKTIGLFILMVQSGIPIPASPDSTFSILDDLFVDIGDDQSITDSLSTFSAHIKRLTGITGAVSENSMVVIDELGNGTDPIEGEALALSVIEYLVEKKCMAVVTTHYSGVKHLASTTPGVENASMEYDEEHLTPTYRLRIGIPGSSRAFDISKRMGLPDCIIDRAKSLLDRDFIRTEETIKLLEKERLLMSEKIESLEKNIQDYSVRQIELDKLIVKNKESEKQLKKIINDKKTDFLKESRKEFENIIRSIKESNASKEAIIEGKEFITGFTDTLAFTDSENTLTKESNIVFKKGDTVVHNDNNIKGFVVDVKNDIVVVQFGAIKMNCKKSDITPVKTNDKQNHVVINKNIIVNEKLEKVLDLRGKRYDEAQVAVEKFVEQALSANLKEIKIIHGVGSGAIRKCIQDYLSHSPYIANYGFERIGEYKINYGVTVVELS